MHVQFLHTNGVITFIFVILFNVHANGRRVQKQYFGGRHSITKLTPEILRLFIQKIVVGEKSQKYSCTAEQSVWIYYRDIELMDRALDEDYEAKAAANECKSSQDTDSALTA